MMGLTSNSKLPLQSYFVTSAIYIMLKETPQARRQADEREGRGGSGCTKTAAADMSSTGFVMVQSVCAIRRLAALS